MQETVTVVYTDLDRYVTENAACKGGRFNMFHLTNPIAVAEAKALCSRCTVRRACQRLADEIEASLMKGEWTRPDRLAAVWGGETPTERANRRKRLGLSWRDFARETVYS